MRNLELVIDQVN